MNNEEYSKILTEMVGMEVERIMKKVEEFVSVINPRATKNLLSMSVDYHRLKIPLMKSSGIDIDVASNIMCQDLQDLAFMVWTINKHNEPNRTDVTSVLRIHEMHEMFHRELGELVINVLNYQP